MTHTNCTACGITPADGYPNHIDEDHLKSYIQRLKAMGGDEYADSILSTYLVYCEVGKLCLCVKCALEFQHKRNELIESYGGSGWIVHT